MWVKKLDLLFSVLEPWGFEMPVCMAASARAVYDKI